MYKSKEKKGLTHFLEHLLFKGPAKRKKIKDFEGAGGNIGGQTSPKVLSLSFLSPDNSADEGVDFLIDLAKNPNFTEKGIEKEKDVIYDEIGMVLDDPASYVEDKAESSLYLEPFSIPLIGSRETLFSFKKKDLLEKHREVFSPKNLVV